MKSTNSCLTLAVDVDAGASLEDAFAECEKLRARTGLNVAFKFNGISCYYYGQSLKELRKAYHAEAETLIPREHFEKAAELIAKGYRVAFRESRALEKEIQRITDTCCKDDLVNWLSTRAELCGLGAEDLIGKNMMYLLAMIFRDPIRRNK